MRLAEAFAIEGIALNILFATDNSVVFPFFSLPFQNYCLSLQHRLFLLRQATLERIVK
jgi:hypothetical protein